MIWYDRWIAKLAQAVLSISGNWQTAGLNRDLKLFKSKEPVLLIVVLQAGFIHSMPHIARHAVSCPLVPKIWHTVL